MPDRRRHVLVTGGRRGLGLEFARHFLQQGDDVTTCAQSEMPLLDADRHYHVIADVGDPGDVERVFADIRRVRGSLDVLINNAGVASMNLAALTSAKTVRRLLQVNVEGTVLMSQAALRLLRSSPCPRIVNLTTVAVPLRLPGEAIYAASKSAVETFTRIVAREFGPLGVTCNAVGPSPIRTDLLRGVPDAPLDELIKRQAIPRWATAQDVINVIDFFLRPESAMITGQVVYLGGIG